MKIVIVTPLFPPDVEVPAPYVKELATRLSGTHEVTVVLYGHLPEQVPNTRLVCVDKRRSLVTRLIAYTWMLWKYARHADVLYVENGPSVELPLFMVSLLTRTPYVYHTGDPRDKAGSTQAGLRSFLARLIRTHACHTIEEVPLDRPEILPFAPLPTTELATYEATWKKHLKEVVQKLQTAYPHPASPYKGEGTHAH